MSEPLSHPPAFSVIMPVYNHADYVAEAIRSVIGQTLTDWELIVVDDGSTDGSAELVDRLGAKDDRITVLHQSNAGPAAARNAALNVARSDWLAYIDSDDVWYPSALADYHAYIQGHPEARFIYGYRHRLGEDGAITKLAGQFQDAPTSTRHLWGRMFLSHLCVCYRRELLAEAGPYDANLRSCEDYELYLRISLYTRFEPLGKATGLRRRHGTNLSRQTGFSRMLEAGVLRRFVERYGGEKVLDRQAVNHRLGRLYYSAARQYFRARCYRQAIDAAALAHKYRRTLKSTMVSLLARCLLPLGRVDGRELPAL